MGFSLVRPHRSRLYLFQRQGAAGHPRRPRPMAAAVRRRLTCSAAPFGLCIRTKKALDKAQPRMISSYLREKNAMVEVEELEPLSADDVRELWGSQSFFAVFETNEGRVLDVVLIGEDVSNADLERTRARARERG